MLGLLFDLYTWALGIKFMAFIMQLLFLAMVIFSIIGLVTTIKWIAKKKKPKETPGEKWRRTGRID